MATKMIVRLTDEERTMAEDNHKLIYGFMHRRNISSEDYDVYALAFLRAVQTWDRERQVAFSTYAYAVMETERRNLIRQSQAKKRTAQLVSIDGEVMVGDSTKPLVEFIEDKHSTDELEMTGVIQEFMKGLSEVEKKLFTCKYIGLSTGEICEKMGVSRQRVSAVQQQIRKKYQMMFIDSKPKMRLRMGVQN